MEAIPIAKASPAINSTTSDISDPRAIEKSAPRTRKKKLGRAARRRKSKIRAIRASVQILLSGGGYGITSESIVASTNNEDDYAEKSLEIDESVEKSPASCLPTDRNRSLPGVMFRRQQYNNGTNNANNDSSGDTETCSNIGFNARDESMLTSQLGFIPGNGISIVSRVRDVKDTYPNVFKLLSKPIRVDGGDNANVEEGYDYGDYPTVLQLYPLVVRDIYGGGKSDGRKFKSRKRGHSQVANKHCINDDQHDDDDDDDKRENVKIDQAALTVTNDVTGDNVNGDCDANISSGNKRRLNQESKSISLGAATTTPSTTTIEPFPTMYWLTHPYLRTLISQLEIEPTSNVKTMEHRLSSSPNSLKVMVRAHESYGGQRWALLTDDDKKDTEERLWVDALSSKRGVAGIRKFDTVKCLHAHAAHYLAYCGLKRNTMQGDGDFVENLVGRWVMEAVEELIVNGGKMKTSGLATQSDSE